MREHSVGLVEVTIWREGPGPLYIQRGKVKWLSIRRMFRPRSSLYTVILQYQCSAVQCSATTVLLQYQWSANTVSLRYQCSTRASYSRGETLWCLNDQKCQYLAIGSSRSATHQNAPGALQGCIDLTPRLTRLISISSWLLRQPSLLSYHSSTYEFTLLSFLICDGQVDYIFFYFNFS